MYKKPEVPGKSGFEALSSRAFGGFKHPSTKWVGGIERGTRANDAQQGETQMAMNRRNVLIGLGAVAAGGGALLGTGAFSQVEADRSVTINTTGDGSALLQLEVNDTQYNGLTDSSGSGTNGETTIGIQLDQINDDAVTDFDGALTVTNNGNNEVTLEIDDSSVDGVTIDNFTSPLASSSSTDADITIDTTGNVTEGDITITATDNT